MGRVGASGDNAAMEVVLRLPQNSVLDRQRWLTRQGRRPAIVTWIERADHSGRRQARLGRLTWIGFETIDTYAPAA